MAPEQLQGQEADVRSDIFAFGAVVYEMVTGKRAFEGQSQASLIAAILEREPPALSSLEPVTPAALDYAVTVCLSKDPDDRWQTARDLLRELRRLDAFETAVSPTGPSSAIPRPAAWRRAWPVAAALALGGLVTGLLVGPWGDALPPAPARLVRTAIPLPPGQAVTGQIGHPLAISPNGRTLAYTVREAGTTRLYLRGLGENDALVVPQTDGARMPFFSPDSEWVGFWTGGTLYRVPATGGQPLPTAEVPEFRFGAAWGPDDSIIFSTSNGLQRVAATGGTPMPVGTDDVPVSGNWPQFLPDGGLLAVSDGRIVQLDLESLEVRTMWEPAEPIRQARYLPSGHLVYGSAGDIIALSFDLEALEVRGVPIAVAQDIFEGAAAGAVYFASADDGTMVYVNGGVQHSLVLVDRTGRSRPLAPDPAAFRAPSFSPDGQRVSVVIDDDPRPADIWVYDLQGRRERFTTQFHNLAPRVDAGWLGYRL